MGCQEPELQERYQTLKQQIRDKDRLLNKLKEKKARQGNSVSVAIEIEIEDAEQELEDLKAEWASCKEQQNEKLLDCYISKKYWNEAFTLLNKEYLQEKNWSRLFALLTENRLRAFYSAGRTESLSRLLSEIPAEELNQQPALLVWWGNILSNLGQVEEAKKIFDWAAKQFSAQRNTLGVIKIQIWESVLLGMKGEARRAIELARNGREQLKNLDERDERTLAWATRIYGIALGRAGKTKEAIKEVRTALRKFNCFDNNQYMRGLCLHDLGVLLESQDRFEDAENHFQRALGVWKELGNQIEKINSLIGLGNVLSKKIDNCEKSFEYLEEARKLLTAGIEDKFRLAYIYQAMGNAYLECEQYGKAEEAYHTSLDLAQEREIVNLELSNKRKLAECNYRPIPKYMTRLKITLKEISDIQKEAEAKGLSEEQAENRLLLAKMQIYSQQEYTSSLALLKEVVRYFKVNRVTDRVIEAELWWSLAYLYAEKETEASTHLQKGVDLIPDKSTHNLRKIIREVLDAGLESFFDQENTPIVIKENLYRLVKQNHDKN